MGQLAGSFGLMSTGSEIQVSPTAYAYPPPLAGAGGEEVGDWQNAGTQAGISVPVNPVHYQLGSQLGLGSLGVSQLGAQLPVMCDTCGLIHPGKPCAKCESCNRPLVEGHLCLQMKNNLAYPACPHCPERFYPSEKRHQCYYMNPKCKNCRKPVLKDHACHCKHCDEEYEPGHKCRCHKCNSVHPGVDCDGRPTKKRIPIGDLHPVAAEKKRALSRKNYHKRQESHKTYIPTTDLPPAKLEKRRASNRKSYHKQKNDPIRGPALAKKSTENRRAWRADPRNKERANINQRERREKERREKGTHAAQCQGSGEDNPQGGLPADGPSGNDSSDGDEPSDDDLSSEDPNDEDSSDEEQFYVPPTQARRKRHADVLDNDSEYLLESHQPIAGFIVPEDGSQFQPYLPPPTPFGSGHPQTQSYLAPHGSPASSYTQMQPYLPPPAPLASGYPQTQLYSAPRAPPGSGYIDPALLTQSPRGFDADQAAAAWERGEKVSQAKKKPGGSSEKPKRK